MAKVDFDKIPKYSELPIKPGAPAHSNWGVFGDDDEIGCFNFLTPAGIVEAAKLVREGKVFRLDNKVGYASPPIGGRAPARQTVKSYEEHGLLAFDDILDNYNTQEGSQWDGLRHVGFTWEKAFYNGVTAEEVKTTSKIGIHNWKDKILGRGLLIDVYRYCTENGRKINPLEAEKYSLDELKGALKAQGSELKPGTILLIRTGWMQAYYKASQEVRDSLASLTNAKGCGLDGGLPMAEWLWDNHVAALGSDAFAAEAFPFDFNSKESLHMLALPLLGLSLGEQFNLEDLAADCARDGRYEFMVVSVPLHVVGGFASPPNAVAIK
jgi:kynurenine formamidase